MSVIPVIFIVVMDIMQVKRVRAVPDRRLTVTGQNSWTCVERHHHY